MVDDRVTWYADRVMRGEAGTVGRLHALACKRHLDDLARAGTDAFPYVWDPDAAMRPVRFAEVLVLGEGQAARPLKLLDCQAFDIGARFGWVHRDTGFRRFRRSYKTLGRQNGKTMENAVLALYIAGFCGYRMSKLFTVATMKRQARLAFEEVMKFCRSDPSLVYDKLDNPGGYFKIMDYCSKIENVRTGCTIEALSEQAGTANGQRAVFVSVDEVHEHKTNQIWKSLGEGQRALPEALESAITTRGENVNSFGKELDDYCAGILEGVNTAEDFFVDMYCPDDEDDIWDEGVWIKSNPYMCSDPERFKVFRAEAQTARDMGGADMRSFIVKSLNKWARKTNDAFADAADWKACEEDVEIVDKIGQDYYVGLDLSSGGDLCSLTLEFVDSDGGSTVFSHSWMPMGRFEEHIDSDLAPYDVWRDCGLLTLTGGVCDYKNDYGFIIQWLEELVKRIGKPPKAIGVDPMNADGFLSTLDVFGVPVIPVTQSARNLNTATDDLRLAIKSGKLRHQSRDELLTYSVLNAALVRNSFEEIKIDKKPGKRHNRIDPVDALVDAHYCRIKAEGGAGTVDVNAEMSNYLKMMGWG